VKLPPYAKQLASHPDKPILGVRVYTGKDAWDKAKKWNTPENAGVPGLVLPEGEHPDSFRWPVRNHSVDIYRTSPIDPELQTSLARALLSAGAIIVIATQSGENIDFTRG